MKFQYTQGRLKQVAEMAKPIAITGAPRHIDEKLYNDFSRRWKDYNKHISSLLSYTADPSDWKEGEIVEEGEFVSQHQQKRVTEGWIDCDESTYDNTHLEYRRIIARRVKKPDCSQHPKDLFGKTDMKEVAEAIGNLHYQTLSALLFHIQTKLHNDSIKDLKAGRKKLWHRLHRASSRMFEASAEIESAFLISKPFMTTETK